MLSRAAPIQKAGLKKAGAKTAAKSAPAADSLPHFAGEERDTGPAPGRLSWSLDDTSLVAPAAPPIVQDVLASPGTPLDPESRALAEPIFGRDFSHVRVHTDGRAAESAQAVDASAYTVGRHVVFGAGESPGRGSSGRGLLLHELSHTIQQQHAVPAAAPLRISQPGDADERQAEAAVRAVWNGSAVPALGPSGLHVARQPKTHQNSASKDEKAGADTMKGAQVSQIIVWLSQKRVAFQTSRGWIFGSVDTDLTEGSYELKPETPKQRWVIVKPAVQAGLRFDVTLEGALPWTLAYPATLPLMVTSGAVKSDEGDIQDTYNMGYNTIYKKAGPDSRSAVLALASLETPRLFVDLEAYKKLAAPVRKSILDLEPYAAGTGCAGWFDVMRANDPDFKPKLTPEQERAGEQAFYESMRDERLGKKVEEAKANAPTLDRDKVEKDWSGNKSALITTAQSANNGIKAEALHQIWIKYWAEKIAMADATLNAITATELREHVDLSGSVTYRKAKQVNDLGLHLLADSVGALEICRTAEAMGTSLTLDELTRRVLEHSKFMEGMQLLGAALSAGGAGGPGEPMRAEPIESDPINTDPVNAEPIKADPVKADPVKAEPIKADPVKAEPIKTAQAEPIKADSVKAEPVKTATVDPLKVEQVKPEPLKAKPSQAEPLKAKPARVKPAKAEPAKAESDKGEPVKAESDKGEPVKAESDTGEPDKAESDKAESDKAESDKAESDKAESDKAEPAKAGQAVPDPANGQPETQEASVGANDKSAPEKAATEKPAETPAHQPSTPEEVTARMEELRNDSKRLSDEAKAAEPQVRAAESRYKKAERDANDLRSEVAGQKALTPEAVAKSPALRKAIETNPAQKAQFERAQNLRKRLRAAEKELKAAESDYNQVKAPQNARYEQIRKNNAEAEALSRPELKLPPMQRGTVNELKVLKEEGLLGIKPQLTVRDPKTGEWGVTIPDAVRPNGRTVDVKDVAELSETQQLRLQREYSRQKGQKPEIITGTKTKVPPEMQENYVIRRRPDLGPR